MTTIVGSKPSSFASIGGDVLEAFEIERKLKGRVE